MRRFGSLAGALVVLAFVGAGSAQANSGLGTPRASSAVTSLTGGGFTAGIDARPAASIGEKFFTATLSSVNYSGGEVLLSGSADGRSNTLVDDILTLKVVHADASTQTYTHDYSSGCGALTPLQPTDVSSYFKPGVNKVTLTLKDGCGGGVSSSAIWVSAPDQLFWTTALQGIARSNTDGTGANGSFITGSLPHGVAVDASHVYWANDATGAIGRADIDGSNINQTFITGASTPYALAVDGSHVYWTNSATGTIGRADIGGSNVNQSFITGASTPYGIAVDANSIYWANRASGKIGRANLDGTGVNQSFVSGASVPSGVATDGTYLYWDNQTTNAIGRSWLNGTGVNQAFIAGASNPLGLALDSHYLYWANNGTGTIGRANLDGTSVNQSFVGPGASSVYGVAVQSRAGSIASTGAPASTPPAPLIAGSITGGIDERDVINPGERFFQATLSEIDYTGGEVVLAGNQNGTVGTLVGDMLVIKIVHADATTSKYKHDYTANCTGFSPLAPTDLASRFKPGLNLVTVTLENRCRDTISSSPLWLIPARHVYWTNFHDGSVSRATLEGQNKISSFVSYATHPYGIAVDAAHIYWTNNNGTIGRSNIDGSNVNQSFITGADTPQGLAVDGQYIYWTNPPEGLIGRANLDGTGVSQAFITGGAWPDAIAVDRNYIYWANFGAGTIGRANLNGTGVNQSFITSGVQPSGLAVDASHIYWTWGDIQSGPVVIARANLNGTGVIPTFVGVLANGIEVTPGSLYWADLGSNSIGRSAIDGSAVNAALIKKAYAEDVAVGTS